MGDGAVDGGLSAFGYAVVLATAPAWAAAAAGFLAFWIFIVMATSGGALYGAGVLLGGQHLRGPWWLGRRARDYRDDSGRLELLATILACYLLGAGVVSSIAVVHVGYWATAVTLTVAGAWGITELSRGRAYAHAARLVVVLSFGTMWLLAVCSPWFVSLLGNGHVVVTIAVLWSAGAWALIAELVRLTPPTTVGA